MVPRRHGHVPDRPEHVADDLRSRHIGALIGAAPIARAIEGDYSGLIDEVQDQKASSSCVGQALSTAVLVRSVLAGHRIARPSAKAIYDAARLIEAPRHALADVGSYPTAAVQGMMDYGLVAQSRWPLTDDNVNVLPPLDVFQHGLAAMIGGHYRIASGAGCALLIRQALARGFVPCFALQVDALFEAYSGGVYPRVTGAILGGHYMAAVGCGDGWIKVVNSWGAGWGESGFCRIADAVFDSSAVSDILTVTITPLKVD
jgi:hypothetical protein